jgi:hypothetical protein
MTRFVCRNYGPSRQVAYKGQQICLSNDACIETDDVDLAETLKSAGQVYMTDCGEEYATPKPPEDSKQKVTVDDAEAVHAEKFPEDGNQQETQKAEPPPEAKADTDEIDYSNMSVRELQVLAKDRQLKTSGLRKNELVEALIAYDAEE